MSARGHFYRIRSRLSVLLLSVLLVSPAGAQIDLGLNPSLNNGSLTLNLLDIFTGTFSISGNATLNISFSRSVPLLTTINYTGSGSTLGYTTGGPLTLTVPLTSSLTRSGTGYSYSYNNLVNNGTFTVSGGNFQFLSGTTFTNNATTTVTGSGSILTLLGLDNNSTITATSGGLVSLTGAYTTANLGSFNLSGGGGVKLIGTLNNTSATLTAPTGGAYTLYGGTITGGTINSAALVFSNGGGILDGASVTGNINLYGGDILTLKNSATFTGTATIDAGTLNLGSNLTALAGSAYVFTGSGSTLNHAGGGPFTLTLPSGASLTRSGTGTTYIYENVTNNGTVTVSGGGTLQFVSGVFTNTANATVTGSGSILTLLGLANTGTLTADSAGLINLAGNYTTPNLSTPVISNSGIIRLSGALNNTSANLTAPSGGAYTLYGGTITGGTIASGALTFTSSGGTFDGAQVAGNLAIGSSESLTLKNTAGATGTTTVNGGSLYLGTDVTALSGGALVLTGSTSYFYSSGGPYTYTLPTGTSLTRSGTGNSYINSHIANAGAVAVTGGTLTQSSNFTNQSGGALTISVGGTFTQGSTYAFNNNSGATASVTGSGSLLTLSGLINAGTLSATSSGVLQLTGASTTANLGSINLSSGGAVRLAGSLNNTSANLTAPTGGAYTLYGGTVTDGTIDSGALIFSSAGGTLDGAQITGNLAIDSGESLTLKNTAGFTGTATVNNGYLYLGTNVTALSGSALTLTGSGSYLYTTGGTYTYTLPTGTSITRSGTGNSYVNTNLLSAGTVAVTGGALTQSSNFVNQSGGALTVSGGGIFSQGSSYTFNNQSGAAATVTGAGSVLTLNGLTNTGTLTADNGGVLQISGSTTTGNLGVPVITNSGVIRLAGNVINTSANLTAPTGGAYTLYGGTVTGGTIDSGALTFSSTGGILDGAQITGNVAIGSGESLTLRNTAGATGATTVNNGYLYLGTNVTALSGNALTLTGSGSYLYTSGGTYTYTLISGTSLTRTGTGNSYVNTHLSNSGTVVVNGGTLNHSANFTNQVGGTLTVSGGGVFSQGSSYAFTNQAGAPVTVTGTGSTLTVGNLVNAGTLTANNGGTLKLSGTFNTADLGTIIVSSGVVDIAGFLNNTSANLTGPSGGTYTLFGGTITGGTIAGTALTFSSSSGTLDGAQVTGNLALGSGESLILKNAAGATGTTTVNNGYLYIGTHVTAPTGSSLNLTGAGSYLYSTGGSFTYTLPSGTSLTRTGTGNSYINTSLLNSGIISVMGGTLNSSAALTNQAAGSLTVASGATLTQSSAAITQTGGSLVVNGQLTTGAGGLAVSGGTVGGAGNITGNVTFTGGTLTPGDGTTATLSLLGNLSLGSGASTVMELGAGTADRITGISALTLGGQLDIVALTTSFTSGQTWNLFSATTITGSFSTINLPYTSSGWVWDTSQLATTGNLALTTFVPVPEPSTYLLLAAGLGVIFALHRRRK